MVFYGRHFVHHLEICNWICFKLLQLKWAVIVHNSVNKNDEVLILINGRATANNSVTRPPFFPPS